MSDMHPHETEDLWSWACNSLDNTVNNLSFALDMKMKDSKLVIDIHDVEIYDKTGELSYETGDPLDTVPITKLQDEIAFPLDRMTFTAADNTVMSFYKQYGFSSWDVIQNILAFERQVRPKTESFGGIDYDHVYFEGICATQDKKLKIFWGS